MNTENSVEKPKFRLTILLRDQDVPWSTKSLTWAKERIPEGQLYEVEIRHSSSDPNDGQVGIYTNVQLDDIMVEKASDISIEDMFAGRGVLEFDGGFDNLLGVVDLSNQYSNEYGLITNWDKVKEWAEKEGLWVPKVTIETNKVASRIPDKVPNVEF